MLVYGLTGPARADVFQYVDAQGISHFSTEGMPALSRSLHAGGSRPTPSLRTKDPLRHVRYDDYFAEAGRRYQLPVALLKAVTRVESDFDPFVVSAKGAMGLMQIMPFNLDSLGVGDPFDARENILAGAQLLRRLANEWEGDLRLTLASYNAGSGAVRKHRGIPPFHETQRYVKRVLGHYNAYRSGQVLTMR